MRLSLLFLLFPGCVVSCLESRDADERDEEQDILYPAIDDLWRELEVDDGDLDRLALDKVVTFDVGDTEHDGQGFDEVVRLSSDDVTFPATWPFPDDEVQDIIVGFGMAPELFDADLQRQVGIQWIDPLAITPGDAALPGGGALGATWSCALERVPTAGLQSLTCRDPARQFAVVDVEAWVIVSQEGGYAAFFLPQDPRFAYAGLFDHLRVTNGAPADASQPSTTVSSSFPIGFDLPPIDGLAGGTCEPTADIACLLDGRFAVSATFGGSPTPVEPDPTGHVIFVPAVDLEVGLVNGCDVNEHIWTYGDGGDGLDFEVTITDTVYSTLVSFPTSESTSRSWAFSSVASDTCP